MSEGNDTPAKAAERPVAASDPPPFHKVENATDVMFRNVVSTHVDFTYIADHKAYLMITINSLVLAGLTTILLPQLGTQPFLLGPTILLCGVCLISLALSVIAVRPKLGTGFTTRESVKARQANLLFFGNFHRMSLEDFDWAMHELLDDEELLVSNMVRDVYFLGKSLGSKYKYVSASYAVFLYGMIVSMIAFLGAVMAGVWL